MWLSTRLLHIDSNVAVAALHAELVQLRLSMSCVFQHSVIIQQTLSGFAQPLSVTAQGWLPVRHLQADAAGWPASRGQRRLHPFAPVFAPQPKPVAKPAGHRVGKRAYISATPHLVGGGSAFLPVGADSLPCNLHAGSAPWQIIVVLLCHTPIRSLSYLTSLSVSCRGLV